VVGHRALESLDAAYGNGGRAGYEWRMVSGGSTAHGSETPATPKSIGERCEFCIPWLTAWSAEVNPTGIITLSN